MKRAVARLALVVALAGATQLSCKVNDYCLNCGTGDGGNGDGNGDGNDGGGDDGGGSGDGGQCMPGPEICDGKDNDCNGFIDDGNVQGVGDPCANQTGACAGGIQQCVNGMLKCTKNPTPEICDNIDNDCNGLTDEGNPGGGGKCGTDVGACVAGTNQCMAGVITCVGFQDHTGDPELCNLKDDNCNGQFDEGLTNMGTCGVKTCIGGTNNGTVCATSADCTGGGTCASNVGECHQGTLACQGGAPQCSAVVAGFIPHVEICDNKDNDCDGNTDEGFNTATDINNCGMCGNICTVPNTANAFPTCSAGMCGFTCKAGYHDADGNAANYCEYGPCFASGVEVCDGVDNDCDGQIDEGVGPAPNICLSAGECAAHTISCDGALGWTCHYGATVSTDVNGKIIPETKCDGLDNDCNNIVDDHQLPQLGTSCDDGNKGECRSYGTYQCNAVTPTNPAVCVYSHNGVASAAETCDNLDNDCDGVIDNTATPGSFPGANNGGLEWIDIGAGKQMMKYEASKPDASSSDGGNVVTNQCGGSSTVAASGATEAATTATFTTTASNNLAVGRVVVVSGVSVAGYNGTWSVATIISPTKFTATLTVSGLGTGSGGTVSPVCPTCSTSGKLPWTNVTYPQAVAACQAVGATLCSEQQWHRTCSVVNPTTYPVGLPSVGNADVTIEAEDYAAISPAAAHAWIEDYTLGFSGISDMASNPDSGTSVAVGAMAGASPYMEYTFTVTKASAAYHLWVRMWSPDTVAGNRIAIMADTTTSTNNDRVTQTNAQTWEWLERSGGTVTLTAGVHSIRVYMMRDGAKIDAIAIREAAGAPAVPANGKGNTWAYASSPNTYNAMTCNGHDYDALQDSTLPTGSLASCYANVGAHVFDMSGNVKEWTQAHQAGQNPIRGGSSNNTDVGISCALNFTLGDDAFFFPNVGFRCCR